MGVLNRKRTVSIWKTVDSQMHLEDCLSATSTFSADSTSLRKRKLVHLLAYTCSNIMTSVGCLGNLGWISGLCFEVMPVVMKRCFYVQDQYVGLT